ncbi:protein of unknown function (plasmid) [Streptantibioticus cattleyicolor NRRL 8057 = DSM 46488]|nr:protein of unknown function [Streptantibioticus cattleyicolor NRRL 8057 = DSM 46488]
MGAPRPLPHEAPPNTAAANANTPPDTHGATGHNPTPEGNRQVRDAPPTHNRVMGHGI